MATFVNARALRIALVLAVIMVGTSVRWSTPGATVAYVGAFLIVSTGINVFVTRMRAPRAHHPK